MYSVTIQGGGITRYYPTHESLMAECLRLFEMEIPCVIRSSELPHGEFTFH